MHCSLCCGGGGGGSGGGGGDWTQYCNLHCVMVVVKVLSRNYLFFCGGRGGGRW